MEKETALKILRERLDKALFSERTALVTLIPELAESEDERIRKEIISIVKSYRDSCITEGNHRFDNCIAWLEKQGEQKQKEYSLEELDLKKSNHEKDNV